MTYRLFNDSYGNLITNAVQHIESTTVIPFDPLNSSYQKYLEWLAEGNTPEPAEEATE